MRNKKWFALGAVTVLLILCLCLALSKNNDMLSQHVSFALKGTENMETVKLWESEDQIQYVFLPSFTDFSQLYVQLDTQKEIKLGGHVLYDGMKCDIYKMDEPYRLEYSIYGKTVQQQLIFVQSANLPVLFLNTESENMDFIHQDKENNEAGEIRLYATDGSLLHLGAMKSLRGRGNSTWTDYDKKPYSMTLHEDASLLDMPMAQEWILLANADDPSHLRNKLVFDFAKEIGLAYSPEAKWVDLYLNGEYAGLYLLSERNEFHPNRIDQTDESGFLVSMEVESRLKEQDYPYIKTDSGVILRIREQGNIDTVRMEDLTNRWNTIERALLAEDTQSDNPAWLDVIDFDSWVRKYLIEEIFGNIDGCRISQFFYSPSIEDKVYAGPVWDYDHAIGTTAEWQTLHANTLHAVQKDVCEGTELFWFSSLYQSPLFYEELVKVYKDVFLPQLIELLDSKLDEYNELIETAVRVDQIRWKKQLEEMQDNSQLRIRNYLQEKIVFLNCLWLEEENYVKIKADPGDGNYYAYYYLEEGQQLSQLPVLPDFEWAEFAGWFYADTGEPFDSLRPVYEDMTVVGRWKTPVSHRVKQVLQLFPLGVICVLGGILLVLEVKKSWKHLRGI